MFWILIFGRYFPILYISLVETSNIILLFELQTLFEIGNVYRNYSDVCQL